MALQIRRGTDAQRQALSGVNLPAAGEPLFTTDTRKLFIGDGTTAGGVSLTYYDKIAVTGQNTLSAATNTGTLTLVAGTNIDITTDSVTDSVTINAAATFTELQNESIRIFQNNIVGLNSNEDIVVNPSGSGKLDVVGNLSVSGTITGDLTGNVTGNVSGSAATVTGSSQSAITSLGTLTGLTVNGTASATTFSGAFSGNLIGDLVGNVVGNVDGDVTGSVFADDSSILVDAVSGKHVGVFDGDLTGSVFADDSTLLVDAVGGFIPASVVQGTFTGNVTGSLIGNVTGDVTGDVTGTSKGNVRSNRIYTVTIVNGGSDFNFRDKITIPGTVLGGTSPLNDLTITVTNRNISGTITTVSPFGRVSDNWNGPYNNVGTFTTNGDGINAEFNINVSEAGRLLVDGEVGILRGILIGNIHSDDGTRILENGATSGATIFTGKTIGTHEGEVRGSVLADDSSILVDSTVGVLRGTHIGIFQSEKIQISDDVITTLNSNENIIIDPAGTGTLIVRSNLKAERVEVTEDGVTGGITVVNQNTTNSSLVFATAHDNASTSVTPGSITASGPISGSTLIFSRARGQLLTPTTVQANDEISTIDFVGFNGSEFASSSRIRGVVSSVLGSNIAGKIEFAASDASGTNSTRMTVSSSAISGTVPFQLPVVADDTARTALVPTAAQGMMIFMQSGTSPAATNQAQVFNGSNWVNL